MTIESGTWHLARLGPAVAEVEAALASRDAVARLWRRDHTLWQSDPHECGDRLGWLDAPSDAPKVSEKAAEVASRLRGGGVTAATLTGMGGSSLFPELVAEMLPGEGGIPLRVLDSTHPAAVRRALDAAAGSAHLVASKSGTTIETRSHADALWAVCDDGSRWAAITDPGSELAALADERGFAGLVEARPDIGGRFSALSAFGLVPAALVGAPVASLVEGAAAMAEMCRIPDSADNPGLRLAAVMSAAANAGRDKLTLLLPKSLLALGDWIEQLVAESTGKSGLGILPVVREPAMPPGSYDRDRIFVSYDPSCSDVVEPLVRAGHPFVDLSASPVDVGAEVMRWEVATALVGAALGINPFDQPDVSAAKAATSAALEGGDVSVEVAHPAEVLSALHPGGYVAICAFIDPADVTAGALFERARAWINERFRTPVTVGTGPRFLHSTGQLHKGGAHGGVFLQILDAGPADDDVEIPGCPYSFATLLAAQAAGDLRALRDRDRPAVRVSLDALDSLVNG